MKFSVSLSGGAQMGILWTGIEKVVVYGINFVQGVILARLLCPEDFGLTAMLGIFLGLGGTLAESGLGTALIIGVKGRGDGVRRLERQVLGWNVGTAVCICAVLAGLCWAEVMSDVAECVADVAYALKCRADAADPPIDLVYCWYSGKIPDGVDKCRASDNGELFYSIRSVDRFAPWIRRIHVLVNDDAVIPDWLSRNAKVQVVRLSAFIPKETLPLNNSASIEMWLHRVPDLSERFVYSNDVMFLGRPVSPRDFFDARGRMICRYSGYGDVTDAPRNDYESMIQYSLRFLGDPWQRYPHHNMDGYLKSVIEDFWKAYPDEALRSGSFRNRVPNQQHRDVFSSFAVKTGRGVRRIADRMVRLRRLLGLMPYTSLCFSLSDDNIVDWIRRDRPKFFCLNDTEACTDADRAKVRTLLEELYAS